MSLVPYIFCQYRTIGDLALENVVSSTNVDWTNETVLRLWSPTYFVNTVGDLVSCAADCNKLNSCRLCSPISQYIITNTCLNKIHCE